MFAKVTRQLSGFASYLISGKRKDSEYTRNEKDNIIPLYGDLTLNEKAEKYLLNNKDYKHNYLHITLSFSKSDMDVLYSMSAEERIKVIRAMTMKYIKHHTSGYDLENEVLAYAEIHEPIIKEENGKERLLHLHIQIMNYNPVSETALRTTFAKTSYIDNTLETYINRKYNLSNPMDYKRDKSNDTSKISLVRKSMISYVKGLPNIEAFESWLDANDIKYRLVETKLNKYIKILNDSGRDINIRGKGFEHLSWSKNYGEMKKNQTKSVEELEDRLTQFYKNRVKYIESRRSVASKEILKKIEEEKSLEQIQKSDSIAPITYQQKIFYDLYHTMIVNMLRGYFVKNIGMNYVSFENKKKDIKVEDKGDEIVANNSTVNLSEKVNLILEIAIAKGWKLLNLRIQGSKAFKAEMMRQIMEREEISQTLTRTDEDVIVKSEERRPSNIVEKLKQELINKVDTKKSTQNKDINLIKEKLDISTVLQYAIDKYKLNKDNYEVTSDNKINNLYNKQKPKNVIDFLKIEVHLTTKEAITIVEDLFLAQEIVMPSNKNKMRTRLKI